MGKMPKPKADQTPSEAAAEESFYRCPGKHLLPYTTSRGECTPVYCADAERGAFSGNKGPDRKVRKAKERSKERLEITAKADTVIAELVKVGDEDGGEAAKIAAKDQKIDEVVRLSKAAGRYAAAKAFLNVPDVQGPEAEGYFDKKMVDLLPVAAMVIEKQLKFGDDKQQADMAAKVMDATGRGKRESSGGGGPSIVIVSPEGAMKLPWAQRVTPPVLPKGEDE